MPVQLPAFRLGLTRERSTASGSVLLHLVRQLVAGDPGGQFGAVRAAWQQVGSSLALFVANRAVTRWTRGRDVIRRGGEVDDRGPLRAELRPLDRWRACSRWTSSWRREIGPPVGSSITTKPGRFSLTAPQPVVEPRTEGRALPLWILPEFIWSIAEPWIGESAVIDFRKATSSTWLRERCGNSSLTHWPDMRRTA